MTRKLVTIDVDQSLRDAIRLMKKNRISRLLTTDKGKVIGILTERDVAKRLGDWRERKISDAHIFVSSECSYDLVKINLEENLSKAASLMLENRISSLAVCDDGNVVGIITKTDLIKALKDSRIKVKEYMRKEVITLSVGSSLLHARKLMLENGIKRIPIIMDGKLIGIVTESDIAKALGMFRKVAEGKHWDEKMKKISVEDVMSKDVITLDENDTLADAVKIMFKNRISGLPVSEKGKLVGIITKTDLVKAVKDLRL